jgi:hypothetical protein
MHKFTCAEQEVSDNSEFLHVNLLPPRIRWWLIYCMFGKSVYPCTDIFMIWTNGEERNQPNKRRKKRTHMKGRAHRQAPNVVTTGV